jgi:hypothetical protein
MPTAADVVVVIRSLWMTGGHLLLVMAAAVEAGDQSESLAAAAGGYATHTPLCLLDWSSGPRTSSGRRKRQSFSSLSLWFTLLSECAKLAP